MRGGLWRRGAGLAIVLAVHLAASVLAWLSLATRHVEKPHDQWTVVRLLAVPAVPRREAERPVATARPVSRKLQAPVSQMDETPGPAVVSPGAAAVTAPAAVADAAASSLVLVLSPSREVLRGALANVALHDPRSNSPRLTVDARMAMAVDPRLCLLEERRADGSVQRRWRRLTVVVSAIEARLGHKGDEVGVCE